MPARNTYPSPKQEFLESNDNVSAHRRMVDSREFQRALEFAQREYMGFAASTVKDNNGAMAVGWKIQAVTEFCYMLQMLSETPQMPKPVIVGQLDHTQ
jgi:hypothetical protein